jgi:hypothetical protein
MRNAHEERGGYEGDLPAYLVAEVAEEGGTDGPHHEACGEDKPSQERGGYGVVLGEIRREMKGERDVGEKLVLINV